MIRIKLRKPFTSKSTFIMVTDDQEVIVVDSLDREIRVKASDLKPLSDKMVLGNETCDVLSII